MTQKNRFRVRVNGQNVAFTEGAEDAERQILNYALGYREEGEVTVQYNAGGYWKRYALFAQWPVQKDTTQ